MNSIRKLTSLDVDQCARYSFDEENGAQRVIIVGGELPSIKQEQTQINKIEVPVIVKEIEFRNIPQIIKETIYRDVNVPVIVKEIEYREIEKPIVIKEIEYRDVIREVIIQVPKIETIEKQVVVTEYKQFPMIVKICIVLQSLALIGLLIKH